MLILYAVETAIGLAVLWLVSNLRVIKQYERGVVYPIRPCAIGRSRTGTDVVGSDRRSPRRR